MPNTNDALEVLKQAREILVERMSQAILDQAEEIIADAEGQSFLSEIETLYDQMGNKLAHLNQMISSLPMQSDSSASYSPFEEEFPDHEPTPGMLAPPPAPPNLSIIPEDENDSTTSYIRLPAPGVTTAGSEGFAQFVSYIEDEKIESAGNLLGEMLGLSPVSGVRSAEVFAQRFQENDSIVLKAMQIREKLNYSRYNDALMLIHECFGLQGVEAMMAMHKMQDLINATSNRDN